REETVDPEVDLSETEGITYEIEGDVKAGETVTVTATPDEGYELTEEENWTLHEDGTASIDIELEDVDCEAEDVTKVENDDSSDGDILPKTSTNNFNILGIGLLLILV